MNRYTATLSACFLMCLTGCSTKHSVPNSVPSKYGYKVNALYDSVIRYRILAGKWPLSAKQLGPVKVNIRKTSGTQTFTMMPGDYEIKLKVSSKQSAKYGRTIDDLYDEFEAMIE
jgi:hypothetical protein